MKYLSLREIFDQELVAESITVKGWIRSVRNSKKFSFMVLNDGSCQDSLQIVVDADLANYEDVAALLTGSSVEVTGHLVASQGKGQSVEMQAKEVNILSKADESYPLQKKGTSLEFLREIAHLRSRTNLFGAVMRIRHTLALATHEFFDSEGFYYLNTPILTGVDAEGAGEMFHVTTMNMDNIPKTDKGEVDFARDFFGKQTSLCVTGQLEAETYALGMGKVYTFGPTFRAENSNTPRHLAEFWMIEPEASFMDLDGNAELATRYVQFMLKKVLTKCRKELEFLSKVPNIGMDKQHIEKLEKVSTTEFKKITYTEAMDILSKCGEKFEFPTNWGDELQTEHERYLADVHFEGPVIVTDYPKSFKAFYMKQNEDGKTVRAMDVLVPGMGELIGGSQREDDMDKLKAMMKEKNIPETPLWWYLELRKNGSVPHSGFGLGFERMVCYATGMKNIRDVIPFPRTPNNLDF